MSPGCLDGMRLEVAKLGGLVSRAEKGCTQTLKSTLRGCRSSRCRRSYEAKQRSPQPPRWESCIYVPACCGKRSPRENEVVVGRSPVDEVVADEHAVDLCFVLDVPIVMPPVFMAVVRIQLAPRGCVALEVVDVVPEGLLHTGVHVRTFAVEATISPVLIERHSFGDPHRVDKASVPAFRLRASAYDPVSYLSFLAYLWLTRRQGAKPIERIRSESVVPRHNV